MNRKRLAELQDGVIVDDDVRASDGSVLVTRGTVLTASVRKKLRKANIVTIAVTEESAGLADLIAEVDEERPPDKRGASRSTRYAPHRLDDGTSGRKAPPPEEKKKTVSQTTLTQQRLLRVAVMFSDYKEDELMRELCRLAIRSAKEGWVGG